MTIRTQSLLSLSALLSLTSFAAAQFTPGNLVVTRVGTGAAALSNAATAVFLDEYTTGGALVQSIALPTAPSGANLACTASGTATSEGLITQSADGNWFVYAGYSAAPGLAAVAGTTSAVTPRVVARIGRDGTIDTTTSINNVISAGNPRSATTTNGIDFWVGSSNSGAVYTTLGAFTGLQLNTAAPTNVRVVDIYQGQLYTTSSSGTAHGILGVGTGLPTTAGQTLTQLTGFPTATNSPYDYFFADANTVYVADDRAVTSGGGIQKWVNSGGTWTNVYTLSTGTAGARGLSGYVVNGVATLFATSAATQPTLFAITDLGAGSPGATLATSPTNTAFRGLRVVKVPAGVSFGGTGSPTTVGVPTIAPMNGLPTIGNGAFAVGAGNLVPSGFGFGLLSIGGLLPSPGIPVPGAPLTVEIYVNPMSTQLVLADGSGAGSMPFGIPNATAFAGLPMAAQFVAFDGAMLDPTPIGTSVGMGFVVGF